MLCTRCNKYIKLRHDNTFTSFLKHQGGKPCKVDFVGMFLSSSSISILSLSLSRCRSYFGWVTPPSYGEGMSDVAQDAYHARPRRMQSLSSIRDGHGDSPRRPRYAHFTNTSPLPFSLSPHRERAASSVQKSYNNDVFHWCPSLLTLLYQYFYLHYLFLLVTSPSLRGIVLVTNTGKIFGWCYA